MRSDYIYKSRPLINILVQKMYVRYDLSQIRANLKIYINMHTENNRLDIFFTFMIYELLSAHFV